MPTSVGQNQHSSAEETLALFSHAWARGDVDGLMSLMAENSVYRSSEGRAYTGHVAIRDAFQAICLPPVGEVVSSPPPAPPIFFDRHCLSFWALDLGAGVVQGIDLISFNADGLITCKDAYRKSNPSD